MGLLIFLGAVLAIGWLFWTSLGRNRGPRTLVRSQLSDENNYAKDETFRTALKYGREVEVHGESYSNPDGVSRTAIIATLKVGDMLQFVREPDNKFDPNAILIMSPQGAIGYVNSGDAAEIAMWMDRGERIAPYICSIAGGPERGKKNYGVWLRVLSLEQLPGWIKAAGDEKPVI